MTTTIPRYSILLTAPSYEGVKTVHTIRDKEKLIKRVRRLRGQTEAIEHALENEKECTDVLQLIAAVRGAVNGLMQEVLVDHIRTHMVNPKETPANQTKNAELLAEIVRSYLK